MVGDWKTEQTHLFKDDADHERFLARLAERVEQYHIRMYLFVCMTNHFHLVFETPEANCSKFMHALTTAYTVYYNLRHGRHGHLLDGRFKAKLVDGDDYILALSRYVHLNPAQVGRQKRKPIEDRIMALRAWRWSSYPSYIGQSKALDFVKYGPILSEMTPRRGSGQAGKQRAYREFVESGLADNDADFQVALKQSPRSIGSDGFRAWVDELYQQRMARHARLEDVAFRHRSEPLSGDQVLDVLGGIFGVEEGAFRRRSRYSALRGVAARFLIQYAGVSQREAARILGSGSGAGVCNQLKRLPAKLANDRLLRKRVQQIEDALRALKAKHSRKPRPKQ